LPEQVIHFATGSLGKYREARDFMRINEPAPKLSLLELEFKEIQTKDVREVAGRKGLDAFAKINEPVLVDKFAVYFERYPTFPGTLAKYVIKGVGLKGIYKLVKPGDRVAFVSELVFTQDGGKQKFFHGRVDGQISPWKAIFETDLEPLFGKLMIPDGASISYYELKMDPIEGNFFGCRIRALEQFLVWYRQHKSL
jgi:inosine/xanthosine triphosphate pyrophosphatase family protein